MCHHLIGSGFLKYLPWVFNACDDLNENNLRGTENFTKILNKRIVLKLQMTELTCSQ